MEFFLTDPQVARLPSAETRILDLRAEPYPDGKRVHVNLELTPFQQRPYIELTLNDPDGNEVSSASIVEPMGWKLELTLHLRKPNPSGGTYILATHLFYPDLGEMDQRELSVQIQPPAD
jgi:hypothetical protein